MPYKDPAKQKAAQHASYLRHKQKVIGRTQREREKRRSVVRIYKLERGCDVCDYARCDRALHAHHHNKDKEKGIAEMVRDCANLDSILYELAKCRILCANCHIEEHVALE